MEMKKNFANFDLKKISSKNFFIKKKIIIFFKIKITDDAVLIDKMFNYKFRKIYEDD